MPVSRDYMKLFLESLMARKVNGYNFKLIDAILFLCFPSISLELRGLVYEYKFALLPRYIMLRKNPRFPLRLHDSDSCKIFSPILSGLYSVNRKLFKELVLVFFRNRSIVVLGYGHSATNAGALDNPLVRLLRFKGYQTLRYLRLEFSCKVPISPQS